MNSLEDHIITEENLFAYADVCLDLAAKIPEVHASRHPFDTLIIPSRGAVPFFCGMVYGLEKLRLFDADCENFYNNLGAQASLSNLLPQNSPITEKGVYNKKIRVMLAPFTADLNVERACPGENNDDYVKNTREYWARVTAAMFKRPDERGEDPFFKSFTKTVLRTIEQRPEVAEIYELFPQAERTAIMDTVISGRAATDILTSFEKIAVENDNANINPHAFLIVDKNGTRMQPKFRTYLQRQVDYGVANFFNASHIVSEDKGASMLGMGAVVYPTIMRDSMQFERNGKEFFVGAGSWYPVYDLGEPYMTNFRTFMQLIYDAINYRFDRGYGGEGSVSLGKFREEMHKYIQYVRDNRIFSNSDTLDLRTVSINPQYHPSFAYETKSFVGHVGFNPQDTRSITNHFSLLPGVSLRQSQSHAPFKASERTQNHLK